MLKTYMFRQHPLRIDTEEPAYVSCGVCCVMMVLNAFCKVHLTMGTEKQMYSRWHCRATPGMLGATMAFILSTFHLDVKLVHESPELLENRDRNYPFDAEHPPTGEPYFPPETHAKILDEHRGYINRGGFRVETGMPVTARGLRQVLAQERLVIVQRIMPGEDNERVMHWILLYGYEDGRFFVRDPLAGSMQMTGEELDACTDTPFGASYISVGKKTAHTGV